MAESLNITGHAINLSNGDVEVLACGEPGAISELAAWLKDGPRMANVTAIQAADADLEELEKFATG